MIDSEEALHIILENTVDFGVEEISFTVAQNRVLKEDIFADRDFPPFHRVSMDGIAVNYDSIKNGITTFGIEGIQPAGSPQLTLEKPENCIEVMTGAVLPKNTDTVMRYEDLTIKNGKASINVETIKKNQNVHRKGSDRKENDILVRKNTLISAAEIGIISTVGKVMVKVARQPKVMVISTGDELVDVSEKPLAHQIRKSNVYTLIALLKKLNIEAHADHIPDQKNELKEKIQHHLENYDVLLFSGAVSKGKYDYLPDVLDELGVQKLFHKVAQRPGKPFWFGVNDVLSTGERNEKRTRKVIVFAFPGNPVSTFVGCLKYFYPWHQKSVEIAYSYQGKAILGEDFTFTPKLTYYLQVKLDMDGGLKIAKPVMGNGSGDLANLAEIDGFLELPADKTEFNAGETYPLITFRN